MVVRLLVLRPLLLLNQDLLPAMRRLKSRILAFTHGTGLALPEDTTFVVFVLLFGLGGGTGGLGTRGVDLGVCLR